MRVGRVSVAGRADRNADPGSGENEVQVPEIYDGALPGAADEHPSKRCADSLSIHRFKLS
jgi:hypothetical protein